MEQFQNHERDNCRQNISGLPIRRPCLSSAECLVAILCHLWPARLLNRTEGGVLELHIPGTATDVSDWLLPENVAGHSYELNDQYT